MHIQGKCSGKACCVGKRSHCPGFHHAQVPPCVQHNAAVWEANTDLKEPVGADPEPLPSSAPSQHHCHPLHLCLIREGAPRRDHACSCLVRTLPLNLVHEVLILFLHGGKVAEVICISVFPLPQTAARTDWRWELQSPEEGKV